MSLVAVVLSLVVALLHVGFLVLEMFLWTRPTGRKIFRTSAADAEVQRVLAGNQGLYNGFLAAGLVWGALWGRADVLSFFLACVIIAGAYGALTVNRRIFVVQSVPAIAALLAVWLG